MFEKGMSRAEIEVEAIVNPTESLEKVEAAVKNVMGDIHLTNVSRGDGTLLKGYLNGIESLHFLKTLLKKMRIRDAARAFFERASKGNILTFGFNRQAAYVGRVSFYRQREAALGPIQITIRGDIDQIIEYLCR